MYSTPYPAFSPTVVELELTTKVPWWLNDFRRALVNCSKELDSKDKFQTLMNTVGGADIDCWEMLLPLLFTLGLKETISLKFLINLLSYSIFCHSAGYDILIP